MRILNETVISDVIGDEMMLLLNLDQTIRHGKWEWLVVIR